jgi:hypothetical protein
MLLAENAALSAHGFIREDGLELPKEEGQEAAQEDREVLEGMYAPGCESLDRASIPATSGMPRTGVGTKPVGMYRRMGMRNRNPERARENPHPGPLGQIRWIRRFRKGGRPSTAPGSGATNLKE